MPKPVNKGRVILWSIATAGFLTILKLGVGFMAQSMAIAASAIDSLMDVLVSTVNFISLREAEKPADEDHAYGHGKIESLAGLFQSLVISLSGLYLIYESARRWIEGKPLANIDIGIVVMIISMALTFFLVKKLKSVADHTGSMIVGTESLHFTIDFLTNGGVIAALLLAKFTGQTFWDFAIAILIALFILKESFGIMRNAIDELIDRALPEEIQREIGAIILSHDSKILGFHNLRTRKIGETKVIEFHMELEKNLAFEEAHNLTEAVIAKIHDRFPGSDVNVHFDPEGGV